MRMLTIRKNVLIIVISALTCVIGIMTPGNATETKPTDHCTFCDTWRPYSSDGTTFASSDVFVVTRDSLALPGCSPVKARVVQQGFDKDLFGDPARPLPIYVLYELKEDPKCKRPMPTVHAGSLIEVHVDQPQFGAGSERMEASIVQTTKHEYGQRTPAETRWHLIRQDYNPGDEGSGLGAGIVVRIEHRKVDEKLNEEWQRLLKVTDEKKRAEFIRSQRRWLKAIDKRCREDGGAAPQWEAVYFTECLTDAFKTRIEEFRNLRNCILEKRTSCPALATDDPSVNNERYR
jgi:uncharacterized protein YecT (DUF1311 family)